MTTNAPRPVPPASASWPARCTSRSTTGAAGGPARARCTDSSPLSVPMRVHLDAAGAVARRAGSGRTGTRCPTGRRGRPGPRRGSARPSSCSSVTSPTVPNRCAPIWWCGYWRRKTRSTVDAREVVLVLEQVRRPPVSDDVLLHRGGRERQRLELALHLRARCAAGCVAARSPRRAVEPRRRSRRPRAACRA